MEIKIIKEQSNRLLKRKEIIFKIDHTKMKGTPQRLEVRNKLAELLKTQPELVCVKRVVTRTGTMEAVGEASVYDGLDQANLIEPKFIMLRNKPDKKAEESNSSA